jgi:hypothetical protein
LICAQQGEIFMAENPYFHRGPIRDSKFFFGRTAETQEVLSCVSRKQSVSVVGPRRIGKTSLLFHLADPRVKAAHGLGDEYAFVYVDCQALSGCLTESDVYCKLLEDIIEVTQGIHSAEYGPRELGTYLDFEKSLGEIIAPGLRIVFMFDEFEEIAGNRQLGRGFFNGLRGLGQTDRVVYVTASGETLFDLAFHDETVLSSPFFNIFYPVWLGFMKSEEARALVDGSAVMADFKGFDEDDRAFLQALSGPHPFYLQVAGYYLFEEKVNGAGLNAPDYERVKRQFAREIRYHFQYAWMRLSEGDKSALRLISEERLDEVAPEHLERLGQQCLVYQDGIVSSVFPEFVMDAFEAEAVETEQTSPPTSRDAKTRGVYHTVHLDWKISGVLLLLVLLLGALLVWQAPAFVERSALSIWNALIALWSALGQIGDASGGLVVIILVLSITVAGIKERKRIRQILYDLWDRLT